MATLPIKQRKTGVIAEAFEETYGRPLIEGEGISSFIYGFLGLPIKYEAITLDEAKKILAADGFTETENEHTGETTLTRVAQIDASVSDPSVVAPPAETYHFNKDGQLVELVANPDDANLLIERAVLARKLDLNVYNNLFEQFLVGFGLPRMIKNAVKFFNEGILNAAYRGLAQLKKDMAAKSVIEVAKPGASSSLSIDSTNSSSVDPNDTVKKKHLGYQAAWALAGLGEWVFWGVARLGQSLTSPMAAIRQTNENVALYISTKAEESNYTFLNTHHERIGQIAGYAAAAFRAALFVATFTALTLAFAPWALTHLAAMTATSSVGTTALTGFMNGAAWLGSLPGVSYVGSLFVTGFNTLASFVGLSLPASMLPAGTVAADALVLTGALLTVRPLARRISPFAPWVLGVTPSAAPLPGPSGSGDELKGEEEKGQVKTNTITPEPMAANDAVSEQIQMGHFLMNLSQQIQAIDEEIANRASNSTASLASVHALPSSSAMNFGKMQTSELVARKMQLTIQQSQMREQSALLLASQLAANQRASNTNSSVILSTLRAGYNSLTASKPAPAQKTLANASDAEITAEQTKRNQQKLANEAASKLTGNGNPSLHGNTGSNVVKLPTGGATNPNDQIKTKTIGSPS